MIIMLCKSWKTDYIINEHNILTISNLKTLRLVFYSLLVSEISKRPCCSVAQSCLALCDPMDCSTSGFPILHHLLESDKTPVHWVTDAIQLSCPLLSPSSPTFNLSQHQGLFKWVSIRVLKMIRIKITSCSGTKLCLTLCELMYCTTPGCPVLHYLPEIAPTQVHWVGEAIQPFHPLSSPSPLSLHLSQHQGLF